MRGDDEGSSMAEVKPSWKCFLRTQMSCVLQIGTMVPGGVLVSHLILVM